MSPSTTRRRGAGQFVLGTASGAVQSLWWHVYAEASATSCMHSSEEPFITSVQRWNTVAGFGTGLILP